MPLGAFRTGFLGSVAAAGGGGAATGGQALTAIGEDLTTTNYSTIAYAGRDTDGNPTFVVAYDDTSATAGSDNHIQMFRVETDGTVTFGTDTAFDSTLTSETRFVRMTTEMDNKGAGYNNEDNEESYGLITYNSANEGSFYKAFEIDQDNLSVTLGTRVSVTVYSSLGDLTYVGGQKYVFGRRAGNNSRYWVMHNITRTSGSTTVSGGSEFPQTVDGSGWTSAYAMGYPDDKHFLSLRLGNNDGSGYSALREYSGSIYDSGDPLTDEWGTGGEYNNTHVQLAKMNTSNRAVHITSNTGGGEVGVYIRAANITWNSGSTAPTVSVGTSVQVSSSSEISTSIVSNPDGDSGYIFQSSGSTLQYQGWTCTDSDTTLSIDDSWTDSGESIDAAGIMYATSATNSDSSLKYYVVGIKENSTNDYKIFTLVEE